jgi:hypothetical protein
LVLQCNTRYVEDQRKIIIVQKVPSRNVFVSSCKLSAVIILECFMYRHNGARACADVMQVNFAASAAFNCLAATGRGGRRRTKRKIASCKDLSDRQSNRQAGSQTGRQAVRQKASNWLNNGSSSRNKERNARLPDLLT